MTGMYRTSLRGLWGGRFTDRPLQYLTGGQAHMLMWKSRENILQQAPEGSFRRYPEYPQLVGALSLAHS